MPTFNFSPDELRAVGALFRGAGSQRISALYQGAVAASLTDQERTVARQIFPARAVVWKCRLTGEPL
jgi:hypothetical protein